MPLTEKQAQRVRQEIGERYCQDKIDKAEKYCDKGEKNPRETMSECVLRILPILHTLPPLSDDEDGDEGESPEQGLGNYPLTPS